MSQSKIKTWPALRRAVKNLQRRGKKVVFTNGCFDLIHAGHLKVLKACRGKGDALIVALNSDASVRRIKGPKRPILPASDRGALMAGFEDVQFVTFFSEDTPAKLIKFIKPDILVKGGDWRPNQIVGREDVKKVVRIPLVKGRSTTNIIDTIVRRYGRKN